MNRNLTIRLHTELCTNIGDGEHISLKVQRKSCEQIYVPFSKSHILSFSSSNLLTHPTTYSILHFSLPAHTLGMHVHSSI